jgi:transcriptional regulator NrdR family protein
MSNDDSINKNNVIDIFSLTDDEFQRLIERNIDITLNDNDHIPRQSTRAVKKQMPDKELESIIQKIADKLHATDNRPLFAAAYAGITIERLEELAEVAVKKGREPIKLFMHMIKQEPEWHEREMRKSTD